MTLTELQAMVRKAYDLAVEIGKPADAVALLAMLDKLSGL
jgi:hypothetical protein